MKRPDFDYLQVAATLVWRNSMLYELIKFIIIKRKHCIHLLIILYQTLYIFSVSYATWNQLNMTAKQMLRTLHQYWKKNHSLQEQGKVLRYLFIN